MSRSVIINLYVRGIPNNKLDQIETLKGIWNEDCVISSWEVLEGKEDARDLRCIIETNVSGGWTAEDIWEIFNNDLQQVFPGTELFLSDLVKC